MFMNVILLSLEYALFISCVPGSLLNFSATLKSNSPSIDWAFLSTSGFGGPRLQR